jgi:hypothetical protein
MYLISKVDWISNLMGEQINVFDIKSRLGVKFNGRIN